MRFAFESYPPGRAQHADRIEAEKIRYDHGMLWWICDDGNRIDSIVLKNGARSGQSAGYA